MSAETKLLRAILGRSAALLAVVLLLAPTLAAGGGPKPSFERPAAIDSRLSDERGPAIRPERTDEGQAGEPAEAGDAASGERPPAPRVEAFRAVSRYLQLDEDQREAWKNLLAELREQVAPLREQLQSVRQELRDELGAPDPDPATVGTLMLEARDLEQQIRAAREEYRQDFSNLLDAEQNRKLEAIHAAARLEPLLPAFRATALIGPPHHRPRR